MKKTLSVLLALVFIFSASLAVSASFDEDAEGATVGVMGFITEDHKTCRLGGVASRDCVEGDIVIPATVNFSGLELPVTVIDIYAFSGCSGMTGIKIPDSVRVIGRGAFQGCSALKSINIPSGVDDIGEYAFSGCNSLSDIDCGNGRYSYHDNALFDWDNTLHTYFSSSEETEYTVPDNVTVIFDNAFSESVNLKKVTLPEGLYGIGGHAFEFCKNLEYINIPSSVTYIGTQAFYGCSSLKTVSYEGGEKQWRKIEGIKNLSDKTVIFAADDPVPHLTVKDYDNMKNTVDFICEIYFAEALYNFEDIGYGYYISMILYDAAKAFPEKTEYRADDVNHEWDPEFVRLTEEEAVSVVNNKYSYIDGETLYNKYTCMLLEGLRKTDFVAERTGGRSAPYVKDAERGWLKGYKDNKDGSYSLYYSYGTEVYAEDLFTKEELAEYRKLKAEAWAEYKDFEYKGYTFYYCCTPNGDYYYTPGEPEYREFNLSLTEDGKVKYNYDRWYAVLPETFDKIPSGFMQGDVNGDYSVDNKDVVALFRHISGADADVIVSMLDVNEDGTVDNKDVFFLFRTISEK